MPEILVSELLHAPGYRLGLELLAGADGLDNAIRVPRIQKPGLALAGFTAQVHRNRIQVLGATEISYLESLPPQQRDESVRRVFGLDVACFVITKGLTPPPVVVDEGSRTGTPVLRTALYSSVFIERVTRYLEEQLAPDTRVHGVLVDVMEVGILLIGESGVGKSECALDLVRRGHRLVADDVVHLKRMPPFRLVGTGDELIRYHMEIRGLGILDIRELFGITAVREEKDVELVVEMVPWDKDTPYERLGLVEQRYALLDVELPHVQIPVAPGRNVSSVVEVAARNHLLKRMGHDSAILLSERLQAALREDGG